jgi:lipopolysaccharide export system permease protein
MKKLTGYVGRIIAFRILAVLMSFLALLVLMDMIDNVEDVLDRRGNAVDILVFVGYRLPAIAEGLIPLAVLIGSLFGLLALATHSELIILRATGMSPVRIAALCIPVCTVIVLGHFVLADRISPASQKAFISWWDPEAHETDTQWLRSEDNIVRIGGMSENATLLTDITLFSRDAADHVAKQIDARTAQFVDGKWTLSDVYEVTLEGRGSTVQQLETLPWPDGPEPTVILDLVTAPAQMSSNALRDIRSTTLNSSVTPAVYRTELARRFVDPLTSLVMMLIAVSTVRGQSRSGGPQMGAAFGLVLGMGFLVVNGTFASLGRANVLDPILATWLPLIAFAGLASFLLVWLKE